MTRAQTRVEARTEGLRLLDVGCHALPAAGLQRPNTSIPTYTGMLSRSFFCYTYMRFFFFFLGLIRCTTPPTPTSTMTPNYRYVSARAVRLPSVYSQRYCTFIVFFWPGNKFCRWQKSIAVYKPHRLRVDIGDPAVFLDPLLFTV